MNLLSLNVKTIVFTFVNIVLYVKKGSAYRHILFHLCCTKHPKCFGNVFVAAGCKMQANTTYMKHIVC